MSKLKIWANLAVEDVARTHAFYQALGIQPNSGAPAEDLTSFVFDGDDYIIHFFKREKIDAAVGGVTSDVTGGNEVVFSIAAASEAEVQQWAGRVRDAGGQVLKAPAKQPDGYYYCVFTDPDGHKFNVLLVTDDM